jgi:DNA (cytosine-5)-methyltransferase 1
MLSNGGEIANCLPAELYHKSTVVNQDVNSGHLVLFAPHREDGARVQNDTVNTLTATMGTGGNNVPMLAYPMHGAMIGRNDSAGPSGSGFLGANEPGYTLTSSSQARHGVVIVPEVFPIDDARELEKHQNGTGIGDAGAPAYTLDRQQSPAVVTESVVRRLTPVECERLQGFPDNWTDGQTDGHRYKQMGNAVAVPVVEWIISRMVGEDA